MHRLCNVKPTYGQHTELHVNPKVKHARLKILLGWMDNSDPYLNTHIANQPRTELLRMWVL
jgi:hypothetical protein